MASRLTTQRVRRLWGAVEASRKKMQPFRENRIEALRQYVGTHYSDDGAKLPVPINLLELAIQIYVRQMAARTPQALVTTPHATLKPSAAQLELGLNHLAKEIRLGRTLQHAVLDAMFSLGVVKTGLYQTGSVTVDGILHNVGQPFADTVHLDDWVQDMAARRWEEIAFAGNKYRLPMEDLRASGLYDQAVVNELRASLKTGLTEEGDDRAETISGNVPYDEDEYRDHVDLWDIWVPADRAIVTLSADHPTKILRMDDYEGPECGPYHVLSFSDVPGNIMPLPPVALWMDLHTLANNIFRKLEDQANRQKKITFYRPGGDTDAQRQQAAKDGAYIASDDPKATTEASSGGIDPQNFALFLGTKDLFSWRAGNLDSLGGLSAEAPTLGQEELLHQQNSVRIADMQDRTTEFAGDIMESLANYLFYDPLILLPETMRVDGTELEIPIEITSDSFEGDFLQYNYTIAPHSMEHKSPAARLQTVVQVFTQFIAPFAPQLQAQGIGINWDQLLRLIGKYADMPELNEILQFSQMSEIMQQGPVGQPPAKPPFTERTNVRVNAPGRTRSGAGEVMMNALMGAASQPDEANAAFNFGG